MQASGTVSCPECGTRATAGEWRCDFCGEAIVSVPAPVADRPVPIVVRRETEPLKTTLLYLLAGALIAPVFTFTPMLSFMGWFLASLVHETGHAAAAWAAGCPSVPAISITGHAMATHAAQSTLLCFVIWFGIGAVAWRYRAERPALILFLGLAAFYPLFAFTGLREFVFLAAGHLGELVFATIFLWRAMVGGFTPSRAERVTYATVGWFLFGGNVWLSGGLMFSDKVRAWYHTSGSFGLTNDYIRLAREVMHVDLGVVAFMMLVVTLLVPPAAWLFARPYRLTRPA